ncbi:MAG: AAA-like domain-containing protein, partial [Sphaerospermopsis kisseleviana]
GLEDQIEKSWSSRFGSQDNCTNYLKKYILPAIDSHLVLGLDNIDEIFPYAEITQQFSALLRAWHEKAKTEDIWQNLRLVIAHSQEVDTSINLNQSPFNVGLSVEIGEFNTTQTKELVQKSGLNFSDAEINQLREMIDGHPYLLTTALDTISKGNLTLSNFLEIAPTNQSPYGKFLNFYLLELEKDNLLKTAMQQVINSDVPIKIDSAQGFKLRSLGLIEFKGNAVKCLCNLYRLYFREHL